MFFIQPRGHIVQDPPFFRAVQVDGCVEQSHHQFHGLIAFRLRAKILRACHTFRIDSLRRVQRQVCLFPQRVQVVKRMEAIKKRFIQYENETGR